MRGSSCLLLLVYCSYYCYYCSYYCYYCSYYCYYCSYYCYYCSYYCSYYCNYCSYYCYYCSYYCYYCSYYCNYCSYYCNYCSNYCNYCSYYCYYCSYNATILLLPRLFAKRAIAGGHHCDPSWPWSGPKRSKRVTKGLSAVPTTTALLLIALLPRFHGTYQIYLDSAVWAGWQLCYYCY